MENKMKKDDTITLNRLFGMIWSNIFLVCIIAAVGFIVTIVLVFGVIKPKYSSTASILVDPSKFQNNQTSTVVNGALQATETIATWLVDKSNIEATIKSLEDKEIIEKNSVSYGAFASCVTTKYSDTNLYIYITFTSTNKDICDAYLTELLNVGLQRRISISTVKDSYDVTSFPDDAKYTSPNRKTYCLTGFMASAILALAVALLKETLFKIRIKDTDDIEMYLNGNVIGIQNDINKPNIEKANIQNYEKLLTNIDFSNVNGYKVFEFTSSVKNEGKSTVVYQLANVMSKSKRKCLVIDLDLRVSSVHKKFNIECNKGVSDLATGHVGISDIINNVDEYIDVITAGTSVPSPSIILSSEKLINAINELKDNYDYILLDCPPMYASSDAEIVTKYADSVIFVAMAGVSRINSYKEAIKDFGLTGDKLIGFVLTNVDKKNSYYRYYADRYMVEAKAKQEIESKDEAND